jgi:hypothetical protein
MEGKIPVYPIQTWGIRTVFKLRWKRCRDPNTLGFPRSMFFAEGRSEEEVWDEVELVPPVELQKGADLLDPRLWLLRLFQTINYILPP